MLASQSRILKMRILT